MTNLMKTMPERAQTVAKAMSDAAREVMREAGLWPLNNGHAARFDEACAVYLLETINTEAKLREVARQMRREMGFDDGAHDA